MRTLSKVLVAVAFAALAAPALAGAAQTARSHGIVVQRDAKAHVVVIAKSNGALQRIHMARPNTLAMGTVLQVTGTKVSVVGHVHKAKLRGVVVRRHRHSFALAGNGSVLGVTSPTPPAPGAQVTATVQVTPTELDDDDGNEQVNQDQVANAEVRGTVLSQSATQLRLTVAGFPLGLAIALGGQTIPTIPVGTPVEARVALGPDPSNPDSVVLTLVSLRLDDNGENNDEHHGDFVKAEGKVMAVAEAGALPGSITIAGEHGLVTFIIPVGFGPTGVVMGDEVEAKGTPGPTATDQPTLVRLESKHDNGDDNGGSGNGGDDEGDGGSSGSGGND
jgi:uncharacterized membrane protein YgcG